MSDSRKSIATSLTVPDMSRDTLQVLDLFSGIGGFSLGLERAAFRGHRYRTIGFCEIDKYARRVLRRHWPDVPIYDDVRQLSAAGIVERVDVVCDGFPCQDISLAGQGAGLSGARSGLWFEMFRIITETRPSYVIIENVAALRSRGLDVVLRCLASIGYDAEWHCIPAAAVGAPHRRDRVWIIAHAGSARPHAGAQPGIYQGEAGAGARHVEPQRLCRAQSFEALADADSARRLERPRIIDLGTRQPEPANGCDVSDASSDGRRQGCGIGDAVHSGQSRIGPGKPAGIHTALCDADRSRLAQRQSESGDPRPKLTAIVRADWWLAEPDVGRVANGVSARVDRLKCLGNSIVPQIAQLIGEAILREHS